MIHAGVTNTIDIWLKRHKRGVKVSVQVSKEVEEFFKQWGGGIVEKPSHGRLWRPMHDNAPLGLWSFNHPIKQDHAQYDLTRAGTGLLTELGHVNLSFIRLVGASEHEQQFIVESVVGRTELERICQKLSKASEQFYAEFIQQVNLHIFVGVRDELRTEV